MVDVVNTLNKYEPFMDNWMKHFDFSKFDKTFKGRSDTFKYTFHELVRDVPQDREIIVLELGTARSFVDGQFPGCNSNDTKYWEPNNPEKWDHGAGCFTRMIAEFLTKNHPKFTLYTVDLAPDHIERCKHMTKPFAKNIIYNVDDSVNFLKNMGSKCDLIYLDTGDMTPIEPTAKLHWEESKVILDRKLVNDGGILLIDDVRNPTSHAQQPDNRYGKAKYSIPWFMGNGYTIVKDEYQVCMKKM